MASATHSIHIGTPEDSVASVEGWRAAIGEFIGTLLFIFLGCGSVIATSILLAGGATDVVQATTVAVAHGLALAVVISGTAAISGGHINPAVTFGIVLSGRLSVLRGLMYWVGQLLGAVSGAAILKWVTPLKWQGNLGSHGLGTDIEATSGLVLEIVITFVLVFTVFATAVDPRGPSAIAPLAIGLSVLVGIIVGFPFTGGSMNPARSFGPAFVSGTFANHWVYWIGPLIGGALASLIYTFVFLPTPPNRPREGEYIPANEA